MKLVMKLGIRRLDKVRNSIVLDKMEERPLLDTFHERQLSWIGHALRRDVRRDVSEPSRTFALYEPTHGKKSRGQPSLSYHQYIVDVLGLPREFTTAQHIVEMATDRKRWKSKLAALFKDRGKEVADVGI